MGIETLFNYRPTRDLLRYLSSQNTATQAVRVKSAADNVAFDSLGAAQCVVDGTFVVALAAQSTIDMSDEAVAMPITQFNAEFDYPLAGKVVADNGQFYLLFTTEADGTPHVYWAHDALVAEDNAAPTLKIPYYSPDELTIGICKYDNDSVGGAFTIGTTAFDHDADAVFYQLIGPSLLPHVENIDRN
jgi:hypothetical protein